MVAAAILAALPSAAAVQAAGVITAEELVRRAGGDQVVDLTGLTVEGDVDLRRAGRVAHGLRCNGCRFTGALAARDVVFERLLDLNDVVVAGPVDFEGADFRDRVSFEGASLEGPVSFVSARFGDRAFSRGRTSGRQRRTRRRQWTASATTST